MRNLRLTLIMAIGLLHAVLLLHVRRERRRSVGVRPIFRVRRQLGDGNQLLQELRDDSTMFFNYTRLNFERFDYLLRLVAPYLKKKKNMNTVILPEQRLAMTLRFLAVGDSQSSLSFAYRCGRATVSQIIKETLKAIVKVLMKVVMKVPSSQDEWIAIAAGFEDRWQLPLCVGALDGRHIQIRNPKASESVYFNYKKTFSTILMAAVASDYSFIAVDVGAEGSLHDGTVFKESKFCKKLEDNRLNLPDAVFLPNTQLRADYFFVGDGAFQLCPYLRKPYAARNLNKEEAVFNYRISRGRRVVENAFGILVARWRIFQQPITANVDTVDLIVLATVCLHNFILKSRGATGSYIPRRFVDQETKNGTVIRGEWRDIAGEDGALLPAPMTRRRNCKRSATEYRELLTRYFNGPGAVEWQDEKVRTGFWGALITDD